MRVCLSAGLQALRRHVSVKAAEVGAAPSMDTQDDFWGTQRGVPSSLPSGSGAPGSAAGGWQTTRAEPGYTRWLQP